MWFLAIRQLMARKKQTMFIITGILLGTAAYIVIAGMQIGFQSYMIERLIDSEGHIHVSAKEEDIGPRSLDEVFFENSQLVTWAKFPAGRRDHARIDHPVGWFDLLDNDSRILGYSPQLVVQALAKRGTISTSVRILGVDPIKQQRVTNVNQYISNGKKIEDIGRSGNRVLIGQGLLMKLGASIGENITLSTGLGHSMPFKVMNTFETGMKNIDDATVYAALADVQRLGATPSQISDIVVRLTDISQASSVSNDFAKYSVDKVQSWDQENQNILSVFNMQKMIRNLISLCILLVAGFGIYNILSMIVSQKRKEIGILRSMGYMGSEVTSLFLYQGIIFGLTGGILGMLVGNLVCHYLETVSIGAPMSNKQTNIMISYSWDIYFKSFLLAVVSSLLAGFIPARAAGKLQPIDIIRSDGG